MLRGAVTASAGFTTPLLAQLSGPLIINPRRPVILLPPDKAPVYRSRDEALKAIPTELDKIDAITADDRIQKNFRKWEVNRLWTNNAKNPGAEDQAALDEYQIQCLYFMRGWLEFLRLLYETIDDSKTDIKEKVAFDIKKTQTYIDYFIKKIQESGRDLWDRLRYYDANNIDFGCPAMKDYLKKLKDAVKTAPTDYVLLFCLKFACTVGWNLIARKIFKDPQYTEAERKGRFFVTYVCENASKDIKWTETINGQEVVKTEKIYGCISDSLINANDLLRRLKIEPGDEHDPERLVTTIADLIQCECDMSDQSYVLARAVLYKEYVKQNERMYPIVRATIDAMEAAKRKAADQKKASTGQLLLPGTASDPVNPAPAAKTN